MPNIATVLKAEISRIARKEARNELQATRKAAVQHRHAIAELRRQLAQLQRELSLAVKVKPAAVKQRARFTAKGLRAHRARLGLSAGDYGRLLGVSAQSIYNWEQESAAPREAQRAKLLALRSVGSREAHARLDGIAASDRRSKR